MMPKDPVKLHNPPSPPPKKKNTSQWRFWHLFVRVQHRLPEEGDAVSIGRSGLVLLGIETYLWSL